MSRAAVDTLRYKGPAEAAANKKRRCASDGAAAFARSAETTASESSPPGAYELALRQSVRFAETRIGDVDDRLGIGMRFRKAIDTFDLY